MKKLIISLACLLAINYSIAQNRIGGKPVLEPNKIYIETAIDIDTTKSYDKYGLKYANYEYEFITIDYKDSDTIVFFIYSPISYYGMGFMYTIPFIGTDSILFKKVRDIVFPFAKKYPASVGINTIFQDYVDSMAFVLYTSNSNYDEPTGIDSYIINKSTISKKVHVKEKREQYYNETSDEDVSVVATAEEEITNEDVVKNAKPLDKGKENEFIEYNTYEETILNYDVITNLFSQKCKIRKTKDNILYIKHSGLFSTNYSIDFAEDSNASKFYIDIFNCHSEFANGSESQSFFLLNENIIIFDKTMGLRDGVFGYFVDYYIDSVVNINTGEKKNYQACLIDSMNYTISRLFPNGIEITNKHRSQERGILTSDKKTILSYLKKESWLYEHYANMPTLNRQETIAIPQWQECELSRGDMFYDNNYKPILTEEEMEEFREIEEQNIEKYYDLLNYLIEQQ